MTPKRRLNIRNFTYHFCILTKGKCDWQAKKDAHRDSLPIKLLAGRYPIALRPISTLRQEVSAEVTTLTDNMPLVRSVARCLPTPKASNYSRQLPTEV